MNYADVLILGAGCSGTSLAHYLESFNYKGKIVLLDGRTSFEREQRWCTWANLPDSFAALARHQWRRWCVADEQQQLVRSAANFVYSQIYAPDFFNHFHSRWKSSESAINLRLGERVLNVSATEREVSVITDRGEWRAGRVFDARNAGSDYYLRKAVKIQQNNRHPHLHQTFIGWVVEYEDAVFDTETAVIMDFRGGRRQDVSFFYVLPYTTNRALVESTGFTLTPLQRQTHVQLLKKYLTENFGANFHISAEEIGSLSMTTQPFACVEKSRYQTIGIAGGHGRPSSGYAFHRIQRHTRAIAAAIVNNEPMPSRFSARRYDWLDAVFLAAISQKPALASKSFMQMFERVEPDALIRFMIDESSFEDDLKVIAALPKLPFAKFAVAQLIKQFSSKLYAKSFDENFGLVHSAVDKPHFSSVARVARG